MAATTTYAAPHPETIPMINVATSSNPEGVESILRLPSQAHVHHDPNADLEAGPAPDDSNPAGDSEALPAYKEEDMAEPLPPYMARVRQVMRREEPLSTIMPDKKTGRWVVGSFIVAVIIVIGVGVGVRVGTNNSSSSSNA